MKSMAEPQTYQDKGPLVRAHLHVLWLSFLVVGTEEILEVFLSYILKCYYTPVYSHEF